MNETRVLLGELANHSRGRKISHSFAAETGEELPETGIVFVFGKEFQSAAGLNWLPWSEKPGRLMIVTPPYNSEECKHPIPWQAIKGQSIPIENEDYELGRILASERRFELRGRFLPLERVSGALITAGWRKHSTSGLLVLTTLPLWSLTLLDQREACEAWLKALYSGAGTAQKPKSKPSIEDLEKTDWALLLHYCQGPFDDDEQALEALESSTIQRIEASEARASIKKLSRQDLAHGGVLLEKGWLRLLNSPYAAYAQAIRRQSRG